MIVQGLTIRDAFKPNTNGGACVVQNASITIRFCEFSNNHAYRSGAMAVQSSQISLLHNRFVNNSANNKTGAITIFQSVCDIQNNVFAENEAELDQSCLALSSSSGTVEYNRFESNEAFQLGGALSLMGAVPGSWIIRGNEFLFNRASEGAGLMVGIADSLMILDNLFRGNHAFVDQPPSTWGAGGALWIAGCNYAVVSGNHFVENIADFSGGAIYLANTLDLRNNLFDGNRGRWAGAIELMNVNQVQPEPYGSSNIFVRNGPLDPPEDNYAGAIRSTPGTSLTLENCGFLQNTRGAAGWVAGGYDLSLTDCYWGHPTGPYVPTEHETGLGDTLMRFIDFEPFLSEPVRLPFMQFSDSTHHFGTVEPGSSAVWTLALANANEFPLHVHRIATDTAAFSVAFTDTLVLQQGDTTTVAVTFAPAEPGEVHGLLLLHSNDAVDTLHTIELIGVGAGDAVGPANDRSDLPREFRLHPPHPNPFNPSVQFTVALPHPGALRVEVFSIDGRRTAVLADGTVRSAGRHRFTFDGRGRASGTYFVRAAVPGETAQVQKLLLVR
ncbi:DUF1573 domain-containing protein [bacterium]|nr:DUF1573 domain-containing protein [bacterium]